MNLLFLNKNHCDERSEEAISFKSVRLPRLDISSLVMTEKSAHRHSRGNGNPKITDWIYYGGEKFLLPQEQVEY